MRTTLQFMFVAGVFAAAAGAQPVVNPGGVVNAASYANPALPHGGIAQGSMFIVFGRNLGPANLVQAQSLPLATSQGLGGTSIRVTSGATALDAPMVYTSAGQVAAILPSNTPTGTARLTVTYNSATSAPVDIRVVPASVGIYARNQAGSGPAIVQNYVSQTEPPVLNAVFEAARPGQVMILWGTGLGPIAGSDAATPPVGDLATPVEVLVGSKRARVLYKGRAPGFPGTDQINFEVPADAETGCYVPLAVRAGGVTSNFTSMAIAASGRTCAEAVTGYTPADLERALEKGHVNIGTISLSRTRLSLGISIPGFPSEIRTDTGGAAFMRYTAAQVATSRGAFGDVTPYGACTVFTFSGNAPDLVDPVVPQGLEAGTLTVTGPKGVKQFTRDAAGVYSAQLGGGGIPGAPGGQPEYLDPGAYTVANGSGGADVGNFSAQLAVPAALTWTNRGDITTVNRANPLTVRWQGAGANQFVSILGFSIAGEVGAGFVCTENASRGTFTVDPAVLSALPPSRMVEGISTGSLGLITGSAGEGGKFQARGLDFGYISYTDTDLKNVNFQ